MDQDRPNQSETGSAAQPPLPDGHAPNGSAAGDEVLGLISHVEEQLAGLKKAHEIRRQEMAELGEQRAALARHESELDTRSHQLRELDDEQASRAQALDERSEHLNDLEQTIEQRRAELDEDHEQADELHDRIEQLERTLDHETRTRDERLAQLQTELDETLGTLSQQDQDHARALQTQAEHLCDEHAQAMRGHQERTEQITGELDAVRLQLARVEDDGRGTIARLTDEHQDETRRLAEEIEVRDELIDELESARKEQHAEARGIEDELRQRVEQVQADLQNQHCEHDRLVSERDEQLAAMGAQITGERDRITGLLAEHTELVLGLEADLADQTDQADEHRASAAQHEHEREALARRVDELQSVTAALSAERDEATACSNALEQKLGERADEIESLRVQGEQIHEQLAEANRQIQAGTTGHEKEVEQFIAETERLSGELQRRDERLTQLEQALAEASDARAALELERDTLGEQIDQVEVLHDELAARDERITSLRVEVERRGSGRATSEWIEIRTRRLKRTHELMHVQSLKIRRASDLLTRRFEQCEDLLCQRADVVAAARRVASVEKRINRRRASFRASWTVFGIVLSLSLLGGVSWVAAGLLAPATFAVRATIVADANGRELTEAELDEWQTYHEQLLGDPRLLERTAGRMKRRGIDELADAAVLGGWLDEHLAQVSVTPGRLDLELRGAGRAQTRRVLETYTSALISEANATRERRAVGLTDRLDGELTIGSPLNTQQPVYAAIGAGAGIVLMGVVGLVLWRKLAGVKSAFEHEEHIESVLDEARWVSPMDHS